MTIYRIVYKIVLGFFLTTAVITVSGQAWAEGYPEKSVRLIVPYSAGTTSDATARMLAEQLSQMWGHSVVVENLTGAGGVVGTQAIARSKPDGYTLGMLASNHAINAAVYKNLPYDAFKDFQPIAHVSFNQFVFCVHPSVPAKTLQEFIALAKSKPEQINYGSSGKGGSPHLAVEKFDYMSGVKLRHIPYRTNSASVTDLLRGEVSLVATSISTMLPHIQAGQLRALAVSGDSRSPLLPDVPTVAEAGVPGYSMKNWNGIVAPAGVPSDLVHKIQKDIFKVFQDPEFKRKLASQGSEIYLLSSADFSKRLQEEILSWKEIVQATNAGID
ncbi:MAG TPA: tripartite tricarboxylate transporter substrate binding protein [Eoetvoesiella sp.]